MARSRRLAHLIWLCLFLLLQTACWPISNDASKGSLRERLFAPTADDVLILDGRALTLTNYYIAQNLLQHPTKELALWVGTAALALQNEGAQGNRDILFPEALLIARYAAGENPPAADLLMTQKAYEHFTSKTALPSIPDLKSQIDSLIAHSVIQRNPQAFAELH